MIVGGVIVAIISVSTPTVDSADMACIVVIQVCVCAGLVAVAVAVAVRFIVCGR